jgi:3-deoxy-D-manno-octulosonate 8-phosphate phosphatase (KDO 8-P phosphatase)
MENRQQKIKAILFDADGVITDGIVRIMPDGTFLRELHSRDAYALQRASKAGILLGLITGSNAQELATALRNLGVNETYLKSHIKEDALSDFLAAYQLSPEEVAYIGDDIPDIPVLSAVGFAACPADAAEEVKNVAHMICTNTGGKGCLRELIEEVMKSKNLWESTDFRW